MPEQPDKRDTIDNISNLLNTIDDPGLKEIGFGYCFDGQKHRFVQAFGPPTS